MLFFFQSSFGFVGFLKNLFIFQEIYNLHFKGTSSAEKGTLFQLRNKFDHRGVKSVVSTFNYKHKDEMIKISTYIAFSQPLY